MNVLTPYRSVFIEKDSINSVALNDSPQDGHQRMLVAGSVSVSATGTVLGMGYDLGH